MYNQNLYNTFITNEIVYTRRGEVTYNTAINTGGSAINTAMVQYMQVAQACNAHPFNDLPKGTSSPAYMQDGEEYAGSKAFDVMLNSQSY